MLDIRIFRDDPERVREGLRKIGASPDVVDEVRDLDIRIRALKTRVECLRAKLRAESRKILEGE